MLLKTLVSVLLASTLMVAANAQSPAPPAAATTTTSATPLSGQWRASKLIGLDIYNEQDEKLGDVSEVLVDPSGRVTLMLLMLLMSRYGLP